MKFKLTFSRRFGDGGKEKRVYIADNYDMYKTEDGKTYYIIYSDDKNLNPDYEKITINSERYPEKEIVVLP